MRRLAYFLTLLDGRDRLVLAGALAVTILVSGGSFYVKGRHDERAVKYAECAREQERMETKWRARGLMAVRLADPCVRERW